MFVSSLFYLQFLTGNLILGEIISLSSVLNTSLIFNTEILDNHQWEVIFWFKGKTNDQLLIDTSRINSRYGVINRTKLYIKQTLLGDEGYYTLKIQTKTKSFKEYFYHVILFSPNPSLAISPSRIHYHSDEKINLTCSLIFFADRSYIEQVRSKFFSIWYMIIYNNDPDDQQLHFNSSNLFIYTNYLLNYELNRNDHNQTVTCTLIEQRFQQQILWHHIQLEKRLSIEYKAYLVGNYYFIRSFNSYSTIEINCEEFDGNPRPIYSLIWSLNRQHRILLNRTSYGRYVLVDTTWQNRGKYFILNQYDSYLFFVFQGNYTCLAENYLNAHRPVHQSFRLNIWLPTHSSKNPSSQRLISPLNRNSSSILILFVVIFLFACLSCILSFYYFCLQIKAN